MADLDLFGIVGRVLRLGEDAQVLQRQVLEALNLTSADDLKRVERRLRSALGEIEDLEERLDELRDQVAALGRQAGPGPGASSGS